MFEHKIKTIEEMRGLLCSPELNHKTSILAHGAWDILHSGHITHLLHCGQQANILIVGVTSDEHITKANIRPYVPAQLRAQHLAAIEVVDFVVIDPDPTPLNMLKTLKPDIFAKGFEYANRGPASKTHQEVELVESYGGQVLFSPGDTVFSSSKIIDSDQRPDLSIEKLKLLMDAEEITFGDLGNALKKIQELTCHVVGDFICDSYTYASATGAAGKTPTISSRLERTEDFVGGAGIVAKHVEAAGALMHFTTVVGSDDKATWARKQFTNGTRLIEDSSRPTTIKHSFVVDGYRLLKLDTVSNSPISEQILNQILTRVTDIATDIIILSDFRHGIFDRNTAIKFITTIKETSPEVFIAADSQVASRWGNICDYRGADLIMATELEARFALGDQDSTIRPLGRALYRKAEIKTLILKLGDRGAITFRAKPEQEEDSRAWFAIDSFARNVVDPVGAGDAFLGYAALAMKATDNAVIATIIGSVAAALECEYTGNVPISRQAVLSRLEEIEEATL